MKIGKLLYNKGGDLDLLDRMPRAAPAGGVKIKESQILEEYPHPTRYAFTITGSAPKTLILGDLTTMLEARFRGDLGMALTRSRDEAVQRLKTRMDKRMEKLSEEEAKYRAMAAELEAKKAEYDKTADDIRASVEDQALKDLKLSRQRMLTEIAELDRLKLNLQNELGDLQDTKSIRELSTEKALAGIKLHPVSDRVFVKYDQVLEIADNLVSGWRESLQDYGQPMASEYEELTDRFVKTLEKVVDRVNDVYADRARESRSSQETPEEPQAP